MSRLALALPLLLLTFAPQAAWAQAGGAMPDLRTMSGQPRPDPELAAGTVTVRLVHGEFRNQAKTGTRVHIVAIQASGGARVISKPVDDVGRAQFTELTKIPDAAFYALARLGEDRLVSQQIALMPGIGSRVMLVGRKLDKEGIPVGDPIDDQRQLGTPAPAAGVVDVHVRFAQAGDTVELVELGSGKVAAKAKLAVGSAETSQTRFTDVASDADLIYVARIKRGSRVFQSAPFMMSPALGSVAAVLALDQLVVSFHMGSSLDDTLLFFEGQFDVYNASGTPYNATEKGRGRLFFPLPAGFRNGAVKDENSSVRLVPDEGVYFTGILAPGTTQFTVQWAHDVDDGNVVFDMKLPYGAFQSQIIVERFVAANLTELTSAGKPVVGEPSQLPSGRRFWVFRNVSALPGESVKFKVSNLPSPPLRAKVMRIIVGVVTLLLLVGGFVVLVILPTKEQSEDAQRDSLLRRKDFLYDEIVRLERQRNSAASEHEKAEFARTRADLMTRLTIVLREIDEHPAEKGTSEDTRR